MKRLKARGQIRNANTAAKLKVARLIKQETDAGSIKDRANSGGFNQSME